MRATAASIDGRRRPGAAGADHLLEHLRAVEQRVDTLAR